VTETTTVVPEEAGGARRFRARWTITSTLVLGTAAHLGGGQAGTADLTVLRDRVDGRPLLTGASLAGALRGHLADRLGGYRTNTDVEPPAVAALFGSQRVGRAQTRSAADEPGSQSPVIVFDALGTVPATGVEIRDGVAIDPATGTAEDHKKFDFEVLPAGTRFPVRVELLVEATADEAALVSLLVAALDGLAPGEIALGARRSRGLGRLGCEGWRARRFDLGSADGWLAWLTCDPETPIPGTLPGHDDPAGACRAAQAELRLASIGDQRRRVVAIAQLELRGGLLVRSPSATADAPDVAHLTSGGGPVLPGTGLAGALRARALRITELVRDGSGDARAWVDRLFGPRLEGDAQPADTSLWASRLRVSESLVDGGKPLRTARIRSDRATQGVAAGALFEEEPHVGGTIQVRLELRNPEAGETGLLLLLLKDLLAGDLPVGGTSAVGRGVLTGHGRLALPDGQSINLRPGGELTQEALRLLNAEIGLLRDEPALDGRQPDLDRRDR
jgi:CRISPR/Cas system CSM-associated protein Csm3 (group 7 of RAMP superfamily)